VSGKLIQDRIPELFGWAGVSTLSAEADRAALRTNLGEEADEYLVATSAEHQPTCWMGYWYSLPRTI